MSEAAIAEEAVKKFLQKFTPEEQACISKNIKEKLDEGLEQDQAIAASIGICAPEKATSKQASDKPNIPGGKFTAQQNPDGTWNVYDVPIFAAHTVTIPLENEDGELVNTDIKIGRKWMKAAMEKSVARFQNDDYLPPLHVHHHFMGKDTKRSGFFKLKSIRKEKLENESIWTMFADLLQVPSEVYSFVRRGQLPYRSVEIHDIMKPEIDSLALLDDEVPFFRFKLLTIGKEIPNEGDLDIGPVTRAAYNQAGVRAYQSIGHGARILLYMGGYEMANRKYAEHEIEEKKKKAEELQVEPDEEEKKKPEMKADADTMGKVAEGLSEIAKIATVLSDLMTGEEAAEEEDETAPAPVEMSAGTTAINETSTEIVADYGSKHNGNVHLPKDLLRLKGRVDAMESERKMERKVFKIARQLASYGLDHDETIKKLIEVGRTYGIKGIDLYAESVKEHREQDPPENWIGDLPEGHNLSKDVAKYSKFGGEAVRTAQKLSEEYDTLKSKGMRFSYTKEEYIDENLRGEGVNIPEKEAKED